MKIKGAGFEGGSGPKCLPISISFTDANGNVTQVGSVPRAQSFQTSFRVPQSAATGPGTVDATEWPFIDLRRSCIFPTPLDASATFTVTP